MALHKSFDSISVSDKLRKMDQRYGISRDLNETFSNNFGMEMTIREYENSLFQIEKLEANIKDMKMEISHLQGAKQRAENQVRADNS